MEEKLKTAGRVHRRKLNVDVFEAAQARCKYIYDTFDNVIISWSGGKDSSCVLELCREAARAAGKLPIDVFFLDEEGIQRLLDYGGTVLDQFPSEEPSMAWEPAATTPGQVDNYRTEDGKEAQSVSARASIPSPAVAPSSVPGLGVHEAGYQAPEVRLVRRIYVVTEDEGKLIDETLGHNAAANLVKVCEAIKAGTITLSFPE